MIRSRNGLAFENGFHWLIDKVDGVPRVCSYKAEMVQRMVDESDPFTRAKFIELLGYARDRELVALIAKELEHSARDVTDWAVWSLEELGFPEGLEIAKRYKLEHPEEWGERAVHVSGGRSS